MPSEICLLVTLWTLNSMFSNPPMAGAIRFGAVHLPAVHKASMQSIPTQMNTLIY